MNTKRFNIGDTVINTHDGRTGTVKDICLYWDGVHVLYDNGEKQVVSITELYDASLSTSHLFSKKKDVNNDIFGVTIQVDFKEKRIK
jgi:hypothetical protein